MSVSHTNSSIYSLSEAEKLEDLTRFLKLIAEPNRLRVLSLLQGGEFSVGQIQEKLELPLNLISFHLRTLKKFDLLESRKEGLNVFYSLSESRICGYRLVLNTFLCERCEKDSLQTVC